MEILAEDAYEKQKAIHMKKEQELFSCLLELYLNKQPLQYIQVMHIILYFVCMADGLHEFCFDILFLSELIEELIKGGCSIIQREFQACKRACFQNEEHLFLQLKKNKFCIHKRQIQMNTSHIFKFKSAFSQNAHLKAYKIDFRMRHFLRTFRCILGMSSELKGICYCLYKRQISMYIRHYFQE